MKITNKNLFQLTNTDLTVGIHHNIPAEEYFSIDALNASFLKPAIKTQSLLHAVTKNASFTKSLKFGSIIDDWLCESKEEFWEKYIKVPKHLTDKRLSNYKSWFKEMFQHEYGGKVFDKEAEKQLKEDFKCKLIDPQVWEDAMKAVDALMAHKEASYVINNGLKQLVLIFKLNGLFCKSRLDFKLEEYPIIHDLKSTKNNSPHNGGFSRECIDFGYDIQEAFYCEGWKRLTGESIKSFDFIAVENHEPFSVEYFESNNLIHRANVLGEIKRQIDKIHKSIEQGFWDGYTKQKRNVLIYPEYHLNLYKDKVKKG